MREALCKAVQRCDFRKEYKALFQGKFIEKNSDLRALAPFLHTDRLIRVGGRLKDSGLGFEICHPIALPRKHVLVKRIIEQEHVCIGHGGVQATMAAVRQHYWPLSLRSTTRKIVRGCLACFKAKPLQSEARMTSLPAPRVTVSRPFFHSGIDYAGPFMLRESKRRNARLHKAYAAVFICFATKAIHVEVVSDLTLEAFLAALKRFIARKGKPECLYSDNGTTFVGANKLLKEAYDVFSSEQIQDKIRFFLRDLEVSWTFIPPNAPHFGGLWEAAVKSLKYYLVRIVGKVHLTFEELQTVLVEIESILNSRPLVPLSEDPNDLGYLSPGHFLVGTVNNSFPSRDIHDFNENRLVRWQRVEQL